MTTPENTTIFKWLTSNTRLPHDKKDMISELKASLAEINTDKVQLNVEAMVEQAVTTEWLRKTVPQVLSISPEQFAKIADQSHQVNKQQLADAIASQRLDTEPFPYIKVQINGMSHDFPPICDGVIAAPASFPKIYEQYIELSTDEIETALENAALASYLQTKVQDYESTVMRPQWSKLHKTYKFYRTPYDEVVLVK